MSKPAHSENIEPEIYDAKDPGLHNTTLFDQDEAIDGTYLDEATGFPYDNSTFTDSQLWQSGERQMGYITDEEGRPLDADETPEESRRELTKSEILEQQATALLEEHDVDGDSTNPLYLPDESSDEHDHDHFVQAK